MLDPSEILSTLWNDGHTGLKKCVCKVYMHVLGILIFNESNLKTTLCLNDNSEKNKQGRIRLYQDIIRIVVGDHIKSCELCHYRQSSVVEAL